LLSNSDFITGAFASEYGNALSGVFDLRLRKGNNEKREYTLQAGLLGLNAAAEGPFSSSYKGSYLLNYRYSTLELLNKIGIPLQSGATNFQDLSYHIHLPTKNGDNSVCLDLEAAVLSISKPILIQPLGMRSGTAIHRVLVPILSSTGSLILFCWGTKRISVLLLATLKVQSRDDFRYIQDDLTLRDEYIDRFLTKKWNASTTLNHKFSSKSALRAGAIYTHIDFDYFQKSKENDSAALKEVINTKDDTRTMQSFAQWQFKASDKVTLNAGMHFLYLAYNANQCA
jgi:hypothetical protein